MTRNSSQNLNENDLKKQENIVVNIEINSLDNFPNHPFRVLDDEKMEETVESIKQYGVLVPLIVREKKNGNYEIVSGHRRKRACEIAGITSLPCLVRNLTDDEATIIMVDSNIQREDLLPSERAFAYKMKLDAMKHQGKTSRHLGEKLLSVEIVGKEKGDSARQVQRYIRLTELIPELLEMVDIGRIGFSPAVEISYLKEHEQKLLLNAIKFYDHTPSLSQAQTLKELSKNFELNEDSLEDIMCEEKPNQIPKINLSYMRIKKFLPRNVETPKEIEEYFIKCVLFCKEKGVNVEKLDIKIDYDEPQKAKSKDRDSR